MAPQASAERQPSLSPSREKVVITGRREKEGASVVAEITNRGGTPKFIRADVSNDADVEETINFVLSTHGRLDITFNNAGRRTDGPIRSD